VTLSSLLVCVVSQPAPANDENKSLCLRLTNCINILAFLENFLVVWISTALDFIADERSVPCNKAASNCFRAFSKALEPFKCLSRVLCTRNPAYIRQLTTTAAFSPSNELIGVMILLPFCGAQSVSTKIVFLCLERNDGQLRPLKILMSERHSKSLRDLCVSRIFAHRRDSFKLRTQFKTVCE